MTTKNDRTLSVFGLDAFVGLFTILLTLWIFSVPFPHIPHFSPSEWWKYWAFTAVAFYFAFTVVSPGYKILERNNKKEFFPAFELTALFLLIQAGLMLVGNCAIFDSRYLFCGTAIGMLGFTYLAHISYRAIYTKRHTEGRRAELIGIITTKERAGALIETLQEAKIGLIKRVAILDPAPVLAGVSDRSGIPETIASIPVSADIPSFMEWMKLDSLDQVFADVPMKDTDSLRPYIETMEDMGIVVHLSLPNLEPFVQNDREFLHKSYSMVGNLPLATLSASPASLNPRQMGLKRLMDIFGGLVGSILSFPIILLTAIPLLIESPGPLIFKQKRVGRNGRIFTIYKLRSMYPNAEERKKELMEKNEMSGLMFKMTDDPRITKVGKFIRKTSIDELPQFWNVLKGDMSLVGTRPPTLDEYNQYKARHKRRLSMKPGITGMWQVSGRNDISDFEEVVRLDLTYIDHWSIWSDIRILFQTVFAVLKNRGAK